MAPDPQVSLSEALAFDIEQRRRAELQKRITPYQPLQPTMSNISDCERQMVYSVLDWDKKPLHEPELQARFDAGNLQEREIIRELEGLGYKVELGQAVVEVKGRGGVLLARGRIDGMLNYHKVRIPFEIKSMHPNLFKNTNTAEDFQKKPHMRKYLRQLQMYLFGNNMEEGLFIITDCLGAWKMFPVHLDYGECEMILQRLERVVAGIKAKTYPDRIKYDERICGQCPWAVICLPDVIRSEAEILTDDDLIAALENREKLKAGRAEYDALDEDIKRMVKGIRKGLAGDFLITGKEMTRGAIEAQPEVKYWKTAIVKVKNRSGQDDNDNQ